MFDVCGGICNQFVMKQLGVVMLQLELFIKWNLY